MRVAAFTTHPIQYQAPIWRKLASRVDLHVYFLSDHGFREAVDPGFGVRFSWNRPLLDGYRSTFVRRVPLERTRSTLVPQLRERLSEFRADVVLAHGYDSLWACQLAAVCRSQGVRLALRGEFSDGRADRRLPKRAMRALYLSWFYSRVDHFLPIGTEAAAHLLRRGVAEDRFTVAPYSVDDEYFEEQANALERGQCRARLGFGAGDPVFLFSGKLIERKDPLLFIEALEKLAAAFPNIGAIVLGSGELEVEVRRRGARVLGKRFIAPGFVNQADLPRYFKAADVFVLPSRFETWGFVVNEAMQFSLPCIVSDRVGCRLDLVEHSKTGAVFEMGNAPALAEAMSRYVANRETANEEGRAARERIRGFSTGNACDAIVEGLSRAIAQSRPRQQGNDENHKVATR